MLALYERTSDVDVKSDDNILDTVDDEVFYTKTIFLRLVVLVALPGFFRVVKVVFGSIN